MPPSVIQLEPLAVLLGTISCVENSMKYVRAHRRLLPLTTAALLTFVLPASVTAQTATPPPQPQQQEGKKVAEGEAEVKKTRKFFPALFANLGEDLSHIPRRNSIYWWVGGAALAMGVHPEDAEINQRLVGSDVADTMFKPGKYIGSLPVLLGTGVVTWAVGRKRDQPRAQHLGMDLIESALLSEGITEGLKFAVRRQRPHRADGSQAAGYSFPSGHATMTFAAATVLQQHLGWKWAVPTYAIASYVAISRLHDNRHYASDVAFGAANGIIIGRSVTWHGRNFYASPMLLPKGAGVMVNVRP